MIDYSVYKAIFHKQLNKFGIIANHGNIDRYDKEGIITELNIAWDDGSATHLYASQYVGKFYDRYMFFENIPNEKEKLVIILKNTK
jgi:hypothetical protein